MDNHYYWPACSNCAKVCRDYPKMRCEHTFCVPCSDKLRRDYSGSSTYSCPICFCDTVLKPASTAELEESFARLLDDVKKRVLHLEDIEKDRESFLKDLNRNLVSKLDLINSEFDRIAENVRLLETRGETLRLKLVTKTVRNAELIATELGKRAIASDRKQLVKDRGRLIADKTRYPSEGKFGCLSMEIDALRKTEDKIQKAIICTPLLPKYKNLMEKPHKRKLEVLAKLSSELLNVFDQHLSTDDEECGSLVLLSPAPLNTHAVSPFPNREYGLTTWFNLRANRWLLQQSTVLGQRRWLKQSHPVVGVHNGQVCVAYTYSQSESERRAVDVYDPAKDVWRQLPDIPTYRHSHVLISLNGVLYALGGIKSSKVLNTAEAYEDSWSVLAAMHQPKRSFACATLTNVILAIGGRREDGTASNACEMLEVKSKEWCEVAPLSQCRIKPVAATHQHRVFVFGGMTTEKEPVQSVEQFDRLSAKWTLLHLESRIGQIWTAAAAVDRIYLVGSGCRKSDEFHNVECFYPAMKTLLGNCIRQLPILDELPRRMVYVPVELYKTNQITISDYSNSLSP